MLSRLPSATQSEHWTLFDVLLRRHPQYSRDPRSPGITPNRAGSGNRGPLSRRWVAGQIQRLRFQRYEWKVLVIPGFLGPSGQLPPFAMSPLSRRPGAIRGYLVWRRMGTLYRETGCRAFHRHRADQRGRDILRRAREARYVELERIGPEAVIAAQPNLLQRRKEIFGRLFAMKLLLVPPRCSRVFPFPKLGMQLPLSRRMRTIAGTLRRVLLRGLWRKRSLC